MSSTFHRFATRMARRAGHPATFAIAVLLVVVWAMTGPLFDFSNTWQLVITTGTTVITFLMVFLIQNTQDRDSTAMQIKLDELSISRSSATASAAICARDSSRVCAAPAPRGRERPARAGSSAQRPRS